MEKEDDSGYTKYFVVGGLLTAVSGFAYYKLRRDDGEFRFFDIELDEVGNLEINHRGTVSVETFIKLYRAIYKHARKELFIYRNEIIDNRTNWYNRDDEEGYRYWIKKLIDKKSEYLNKFKTRAIRKFGISEEAFGRNYREHSITEDFKKAMLDVELDVDEADREPILTEKETDDIVSFIGKELEQHAFGLVDVLKILNLSNESEVRVYVKQYRAIDRALRRYNTNEASLNVSIQHYLKNQMHE